MKNYIDKNNKKENKKDKLKGYKPRRAANSVAGRFLFL